MYVVFLVYSLEVSTSFYNFYFGNMYLKYSIVQGTY
jgi:hypothetical protein